MDHSREMVVCPECKGACVTGTIFHERYGDVDIDCWICNGEGELELEPLIIKEEEDNDEVA